jgi:hypothetical protein
MSAREALHQHHLLYDNITKQTWQAMMSAFLLDVSQKKSGPVWADQTGSPSGPVFGEAMRSALKRAETYWVSRDMVQVMVHASQGLDELDRFSHDLWPTDDGFLLFEEPWYAIDIWGNTVGCKAMAWWRQSWEGHPGTIVVEFSDRDDKSDTVSAMLMAKPDLLDSLLQLGPIHVSSIKWYADESRVGPMMVEPSEDMIERYEKFAVTGQTIAPQGTNPGRPLLALLMLLNQTITSKRREVLKPTNPARAKKMPLPAQVTVIRLRRESEAVGRLPGESQVEWHHRWVVRGHWRSQHVGPDYPLAQQIGPNQYRARIYIAPFIKGPEGAPLVITQKVQALVR